jgi:4-carboxymuconolactone decarboxylase
MKLTNQETIAVLDAPFAKMTVEVGQHAWSLPDLTMREKAFVFIAADLCCRCLGFPLETHARMAVSQDVSMAALREAVRHLAPYVGYPTAAEALMTLAGIEPPDASTETAATSSRVDLDGAILSEIAELDDRFAAFYRDQFNGRWTRPGLSVRERALATIATDVLNGTLDHSLRLHVTLALTNGAGEEQIRAVILQVAESGIGKAWRAFPALKEILCSSTGTTGSCDADRFGLMPTPLAYTCSHGVHSAIRKDQSRDSDRCAADACQSRL